MSQGIHTGCSGNGSRDIEHHAGIIHRDIRDDVGVDNDFFHLPRGINDHRVAGHLGGGASSGVDSNQMHPGVDHFTHARISGGRAWVRGEDLNCFRGVYWTAAAEGDDVVTGMRLIRCIAFLYQLFRWVWENLVEQMVRHFMCVQCGEQAIQ